MSRTRKNYDAEFKRHAVKLAKERKNKSELGRELGIR
ncbi:transposase [Myroides sp. LJL116]